jgi:tetratricopeptide (TPR) repeat protein
MAAGALAAPAARGQKALEANAEEEADTLALTDDESEALALFEDDKLVGARARAEAAIQRDPDSPTGHYVLGSTLRDAEGSLARAMSHLRASRSLLEARFGRRPKGGDARRIHRGILIGLEFTAGLMEQYAYELSVLDDHDALYDPDLVGQHAWPLMKLGDFEAARAWALRATGSESPLQRSLGQNALCAIEAEAHERQASYERCKTALEEARVRAQKAVARGDKHVPHVAVHAHNAALGALSVLRLDEAERLALDGTARLESTVSNPWRTLLELYLTEGRGGDAVAAIRQMQRWCAHQPPGSRDQKDAETAAETALLLLVAGAPEEGLRFISRAIERPDRQGLSSGQPAQSLGGHALLRRALLREHAELAAERASARGLSRKGIEERAEALLREGSARARALADEERIVNVLSDEARLVATLRPYLDGGLDQAPTFLLADLVPVLGPGVFAAALAKARREEALAEVTPYFDAFEAEVALAEGDVRRAGALAAGAAARLPRAEALLRARVSAVAAEALFRQGDLAAATGLFQRAIELDPGALRRLGLALPAVVLEGDASEAVALAVAAIRRSPRLTMVRGAFEVHVSLEVREGAPGALRACLLAPLFASLGCAEVTPARRGEGEAREPPEALAARLADELHRVIFALRLPITETYLRSLDGTTAVTRDAGRERLRGILEGVPGSEAED